MKLLAVGYSVRHIVCSGSRAGYEMSAADAFGDLDTRRCAKKYFHLDPLQPQASLKLLSSLKLLRGEVSKADGVILGSGFERAGSDFLGRKIVGNSLEKTRAVANKAWLSARLDDLGVPHPRTYTGKEIAEGEGADLKYPVVAKPAYGGGGTANFLCRTGKELVRWAERLPEFLFQEYLKGTPASVSTISKKNEAVSVCVNEQLIGLKSLGAPGPFVYCGNISPFETRFSEEVQRMSEIAEELVVELGLVGSNGVDFVVTADGRRPVVIEVNPRFQGSLDTVELSTGLNLVDEHLKAVVAGEGEGKELPERVKAKRQRCAAKAILFAEREMVVAEDFGGSWGRRVGVADIPEKGRIIKPGEPVATGIGVGETRAEAFAAAVKNVNIFKRIYKKCK